MSKQDDQEFLEQYFEETNTYLYSLMVVLPLIFIYEAGILLVRDFSWRSYKILANEFIGLIFQKAGLQHVNIIPAFLVMLTLFVLQFYNEAKWKLNFSNFILMHIEYIMYGVAFFFAVAWIFPGGLQFRVPETVHVLLSVGAGIYEEYIFRLVLLSLLIVGMRKLLKVDRKRCLYAAVIISAVCFSGFHHILGDQAFNIVNFLIRCAAGIYFGILFLTRGYGTAAGAHVSFNILKIMFNGN